MHHQNKTGFVGESDQSPCFKAFAKTNLKRQRKVKIFNTERVDLLKTVKKVLIACTFVIAASNSLAQEVDCIDLEALREGSSDLTKQGCTFETEILRLGTTGQARELIQLYESGKIPDDLLYLYRRQAAFLTLDHLLEYERENLANYADLLRSQFMLSHGASLYALRSEEIRVASFLGLAGVLEIIEQWDTNSNFWTELEREPEIENQTGRLFFICALRNMAPSDKFLSGGLLLSIRTCISGGLYDNK